AEVGRWTAKDPLLFLGGSSSLYVYAGNDPVNHVDPDGREVTNNCTDCTTYVKASETADVTSYSPGGIHHGEQDGLAIPDKRPGEIFKTVERVDATVGPDGDVDTEIPYDRDLGDYIYRVGGQFWDGGWKDLDWLREVHGDNPKNYDHGWDRLFNAADPENDSKGCPLGL
ncbi:MAG: hypothetical protein GY835_16630, partial [bacterium]|nr:hypothetical protein [bacterium]